MGTVIKCTTKGALVPGTVQTGCQLTVTGTVKHRVDLRVLLLLTWLWVSLRASDLVRNDEGQNLMQVHLFMLLPFLIVVQAGKV